MSLTLPFLCFKALHVGSLNMIIAVNRAIADVDVSYQIFPHFFFVNIFYYRILSPT